MALGARLVSDDIRLFRIGKLLNGSKLDVDRDIDEHRTRPAGGGDVEGLLEDAGEVARILDQIAAFCEGLARAGDVRLLEDVAPQQVASHLAGDGHQRNGIHIGGGESRDEVGRPGTRSGHADAHPAGSAGVAARGVAGVLFFPHQDVAQRGGVQRVVEGADGRARIAEYDRYALLLQAFHHDLRTGNHNRASFLSFKPFK